MGWELAWSSGNVVSDDQQQETSDPVVPCACTAEGLRILGKGSIKGTDHPAQVLGGLGSACAKLGLHVYLPTIAIHNN